MEIEMNTDLVKPINETGQINDERLIHDFQEIMESNSIEGQTLSNEDS